MIPQPKSKALHFSALQLAWMQELGIDKPWIPGGSSPAVTTTTAGTAPSAVPNTAPSAEPNTRPSATPNTAARMTSVAVEADEKSTHAPHTLEVAAEFSAADSFVQVGDLVRARAGGPGPSSGSSQRSRAGSTAYANKSADTSTESLRDTVAAAAQAETLEALAVAVARCTACDLCKEREQVVLGQGVMQPAIMVIGEGPGDQEDRQGQPFVGSNGVLLDNMLASIGSSREKDVYMTNIVKCRPPGNRNPRPAEIAACRPFLLRQIELVRPFSILALGRFAAQTLVGGEAQLTEMREQVFALEHAGSNIQVVVSYHPSYLMHRPEDKAAAWRDLQRAKVISKGL